MKKVLLNSLPKYFFDGEVSDNFDNTCSIYIPKELSLDSIKGCKFKVSNHKKKYANFNVSFSGDFQGRMLLHVHGNDIKVDIGRESRGGYYVKLWEKAHFILGDKTTSNGSEIWVQKGNKVNISNDCMLAHNVLLMSGDMHSIFELSSFQQINNYNSEINIGDHVWLGRNSTICKGVSIGNGSIVGLGSVITKSMPRCVVAAGNPAKIIKSNISWARPDAINADEGASIASQFDLIE